MSAVDIPIVTAFTPARTHVDAALDGATALCGGLWTLWPFFANAGIPAYQHDWSWPLTQLRARDALVTLGSTWLPEGLGHPNPFANANPVAFGIDSLSAVLPPAVALRAYLLVVVLAAGFGIVTLSRYIGASRSASRIAALFYLVAPPLFNKISAGHIAFWAAYALLPWTAYFAWRAVCERRVRFAALAVIVCGLSCIQPQFYVFSVLFVAIVALMLWKHERAYLVAAAITAGILLVNLPAIFSLTTLQSGFGATVPAPALQNEQLQSASLFAAFRLIGYIIPYAETAYAAFPFGGVALTCLAAVCGIAVLGVLTCRKPLAGAIALFGAIGYAIVTGLKGPAAPLWQWAFTHVSASALFREFYHGAPLLALAYAAGLAHVATRLPKTIPVLAALIVAGTLPLAASGHERDLHFVTLPADATNATDALANLRPGRVLALPFKMPMKYGSSSVSGVDQLAYVDASHPSAAEYGKTSLLDLAAGWYVDGDVSDASALIRRLGVTSVAYRRGLTSAFPDNLVVGAERAYRPRARKVFANAAVFGTFRDANTCYGLYCVAAFDGAPIIDSAERVIPTPVRWSAVPFNATTVDDGNSAPIQFLTASQALTPRDGWVPADNWLWLNRPWNRLVDPVAVTDRAGDLQFRLAAPGAFTYVSHAPLRVCDAAGCNRYSAATLPASLRITAGNVTVSAMGPAGLGYALNGVVQRITDTASVSDASFAAPWRASAHIAANGKTLIILRTRFDRNWHLSGAPATHVRVDAYANGWVLDLHGARRVTFNYGPQGPFWLMAGVSSLCYLALVICAAWQPYSSRVKGIN